MWSFGWLTRLCSPFLKIFWADISKNLELFCSPALSAAGIGTEVPVQVDFKGDIETLRESHESPDRVSRSALLVAHPA